MLFACDGCSARAPVLHTVQGGAKLCDECAERSDRIDRALSGVSSSDRVVCDGCPNDVTFDARVAVVIRECGGTVLCDGCESSAAPSVTTMEAP